MTRPAVTLAIPCRTDEPDLGRTLGEAWARCDEAAVAAATVVCLNGPGLDDCSARRALEAGARRTGRRVRTVDLDRDGEPHDGPEADEILVLRTVRAGKAIAWNALRARLESPLAVFLDADVALGPSAVVRLLDALARHPTAILASPKTACAPRPTAFERIMAAPYGVDFPNLSGQLYAARVADLPAHMPEDLIEPERWLELEVGRERVVREPAARVIVRLPGTLRDFFRQRIRIEMGKVQLERDYAALVARGNPQPRLRAALRSLSLPDLGRLLVYLALRETAHLLARRRYGRRPTSAVWIQAASTKEWSS